MLVPTPRFAVIERGSCEVKHHPSAANAASVSEGASPPDLPEWVQALVAKQRLPAPLALLVAPSAAPEAAAAQQLASLARLVSLDLSQCRLGDSSSLRGFDALASLAHLDLSTNRCALKTQPLPHFHTLGTPYSPTLASRRNKRKQATR